MKQRCQNPNNEKYPIYGGRGIKVCARWNSYGGFYKDMGDRPVGMTIDRIDNDGDYEPGNCKWSTPTEQCVNQRIRKDNKSGIKGVYYDKRKAKWCVQISRFNKMRYLGSFAEKADAIVARQQAELQYTARKIGG